MTSGIGRSRGARLLVASVSILSVAACGSAAVDQPRPVNRHVAVAVPEDQSSGHYERRPITWDEAYAATYGGCQRGAEGDPSLLEWCVGYSSDAADAAVAVGMLSDDQVWVEDAPTSPSEPSSTPTPWKPPAPVVHRTTCADLAKKVHVSYVREQKGNGVGLDLWPKVTIRNNSRVSVTVKAKGHGKASNPGFEDFPLEMGWGIDDWPTTVAAGRSATVELGRKYGETLYVPTGGHVLSFVMSATATAHALGLRGCHLSVTS